MSVFVKFGEINGDATLTDHNDWVRADSFQWGGSAMAGSRESGVAQSGVYYEKAVIAKTVDSATVELLRAFDQRSQGDSLAEVTVHWTNVGANAPGNVVFEAIFKQARVVYFGYSMQGESMAEVIHLDFDEYAVTRYDPDTGDGQMTYEGNISDRM